EITDPTWVVVSAPTCEAFNAVTDKAPNCVVEREEMSLVEIAVIWAVPKVANCEVLRPATCAEVMAPTWEALSAAKPPVLIEPICVLVSAPTALVDSAATSAVLSPDNVVVDNVEAWAVVSALTCAVLRLEMTEATCVLVSAPTCEALNPPIARAPNCVVESEEMSFVEIAATWAVPKVANCEVLSPATCTEVMAPICAALSEANPLVLMEPIWVLERVAMSLAERAPTSATLRLARVV